MKTVIITGTGAGIGFELARIFSEKNYKVISLSTVSYTLLTLPTNREV